MHAMNQGSVVLPPPGSPAIGAGDTSWSSPLRKMHASQSFEARQKRRDDQSRTFSEELAELGSPDRSQKPTRETTPSSDVMVRFPSNPFEADLQRSGTPSLNATKAQSQLLEEFHAALKLIADQNHLPLEPDASISSLCPEAKENLLQELWAKSTRLFQDFGRVSDHSPRISASVEATSGAFPQLERQERTSVFTVPTGSNPLELGSTDSTRQSFFRPPPGPPPPISAPRLLRKSSQKSIQSGGSDGSPTMIPSSVASLINTKPTFESYNAKYSADEFGNEILNQYLIVGELGRGSFATVELAEHLETKQLVAIKAIRRSLIKKLGRSGPERIQRIMTEIAIMKKLHHRNIVQLHEVIDDPQADRLYLVLQYVERGSIAKMSESGTCEPLSPTKLKKYIRQCASGLQYLHRHHIIHRDIKPDNILLDSFDNVYLSDFGVSSCFDDQDSLRRTEGTPAYFSPEVCRGESHLHPESSDVWALGVSLFVLAFGYLPFTLSNLSSVIAMIDAIQNAPLEFPPGADPLLVSLLKGLLNRDPMRRLTLAEIKAHPWVSQGQEAGVRVPEPEDRKSHGKAAQDVLERITINTSVSSGISSSRLKATVAADFENGNHTIVLKDSDFYHAVRIGSVRLPRVSTQSTPNTAAHRGSVVVTPKRRARARAQSILRRYILYIRSKLAQRKGGETSMESVAFAGVPPWVYGYTSNYSPANSLGSPLFPASPLFPYSAGSPLLPIATKDQPLFLP